jgi:hypothetical protein
MSEDYYFWLKSSYHNANFYFIPDILGEYVIQNDNISHDNKSFKNEKIKKIMFIISKILITKKNYEKTFVRMHFGKLINKLKSNSIFDFIFCTIKITLKYHIYIFPNIYNKISRRLFYINK